MKKVKCIKKSSIYHTKFKINEEYQVIRETIKFYVFKGLGYGHKANFLVIYPKSIIHEIW